MSARLRGFHKVEFHIDSWVVTSTLALGDGGIVDGWKHTNMLMCWQIWHLMEVFI